MTTKFPPLANPNSFAKAIAERITYHEGLPRNYRFNAKTGTLNYEDQTAITQEGGTFSLIPLAFRIFRAALFGKESRNWFECFFLNQSGHLCVLSFHSSSVDRLKKAMMRDLLYDGHSLTDCILTVRPLARSHPKHGTYYVADFLFDLLPEPASTKAAEIRDLLPPIYREDTITHPDTISLMAGYGSPEQFSMAPEIETNEAA